jgi:hypothetical protein
MLASNGVKISLTRLLVGLISLSNATAGLCGDQDPNAEKGLKTFQGARVPPKLPQKYMKTGDC